MRNFHPGANLQPGANLHPGSIFGHVNGVLRICTRVQILLSSLGITYYYEQPLIISIVTSLQRCSQIFMEMLLREYLINKK